MSTRQGDDEHSRLTRGICAHYICNNVNVEVRKLDLLLLFFQFPLLVPLLADLYLRYMD
jgi:hypothetical protein